MNDKDKKVTDKIKSFIPKIDRRTIVDIVIILIPVLLIYYFFYVDKTPPEIKQLLEQNKKFEMKIDSLNNENDAITNQLLTLEKKEESFNTAVIENNKIITENNKEILKLEKIYYEKINSVNGYNLNELEQFFTKKYGPFYNR